MAEPVVTTVSLQIPNDTKYVAMVRKSIKFLAEASGFSLAECQDIEIAVAEAVTNSIIHGSPQCYLSPVMVRCEARPGNIVIEVEDEGGSPDLKVDRELPPDYQESGRGTIIIRTVMDEFVAASTHKGLVVKMTKNSSANNLPAEGAPDHQPPDQVLLSA